MSNVKLVRCCLKSASNGSDARLTMCGANVMSGNYSTGDGIRGLRSVISERQSGQLTSWREHLSQNPACLQGRSSMLDVPSKQRVQESSFSEKECNCSILICLGRMSLSSSLREQLALKVLKSTPGGGKLNSRRPKLNVACWNDMKLAAAKNPLLHPQK